MRKVTMKTLDLTTLQSMVHHYREVNRENPTFITMNLKDFERLDTEIRRVFNFHTISDKPVFFEGARILKTEDLEEGEVILT